jgi:hypothetical protein
MPCANKTYYDDLIVGKVLQKLVVTQVVKNGFQEYMKSIGKLGDKTRFQDFRMIEVSWIN